MSQRCSLSTSAVRASVSARKPPIQPTPMHPTSTCFTYALLFLLLAKPARDVSFGNGNLAICHSGTAQRPGPESITTTPSIWLISCDLIFRGYGFRAHRCAVPRNDKANAPPPVSTEGAVAFPHFLSRKRKWSAGRRQGFARPLWFPLRSGNLHADGGPVCETYPEARASCGGVVKPSHRDAAPSGAPPRHIVGAARGSW